LFKRAIDIGYQLMETKSNQKYCQWLSGEIVEKKSLRLTQVRIPAKTFFNKDFFG